ncbi:MAG: PHP domain-containing protein [Candidatus Firestonebacteria bacterium]
MSLNNGYADLHIHTNASDSTFTAADVIKNALEVGLSVVGITDHDTVDSLDEAIRLGEEAGIEVIPGIELSAEENGAEIHILGYCIDHKDEELRATLKMLKDSRMERAILILAKLKELNIPLKIEDVLKLTEKFTAVGRLHIARAMKAGGYIPAVVDAFRRYIGQNGPAYVGKYKMSPAEVIGLIHKAGGLAVLAHPGVLNNDDLVQRLIDAGLDGIEVHHTEHNSSAIDRYKHIAVKNGMLITGGSDCHGLSKNKMLLGTILIPYEFVEQLKARRGKRKGD